MVVSTQKGYDAAKAAGIEKVIIASAKRKGWKKDIEPTHRTDNLQNAVEWIIANVS